MASDAEDLDEFMKELGLGKFVWTMQEQGIDNILLLSHVAEDDDALARLGLRMMPARVLKQKLRERLGK